MNSRAARPLLLLFTAATVAQAQTIESQIEQVRQFRAPAAAAEARVGTDTATIPASDMLATEDDAFGAQQILKKQERAKPFTAFAEVSGFYTNNVALTRSGTEKDSFLLATFGLSHRRALTSTLQFEASLRGALFRYNKFDVLDFNSIDAGAGLSWAPARLGGVTLFARYNFTDLIGADSGDEFFQNHTVALGAQKSWALSRAHALYAGAVAQFGFADPAAAQRDEYSVFAGYHLEATRRLQADLFYRYAYFNYREEGDRQDHNQALSLALRYNVADWMSVSASTFAGWNTSSVEAFDYDVINAGGGLGLSLRF